MREGLNEEGLAICDLICQGLELSEKERAGVKSIAKQLIEKSRVDLIIDWRRNQQAYSGKAESV